MRGFKFWEKDKRTLIQAIFKRDTIFLKDDGTLSFVSYRGPLAFSGFNLHKKEYEEAGCPDHLTVTITTEDVPVMRKFELENAVTG